MGYEDSSYIGKKPYIEYLLHEAEELMFRVKLRCTVAPDSTSAKHPTSIIGVAPPERTQQQGVGTPEASRNRQGERVDAFGKGRKMKLYSWDILSICI